MSLSHKSRRGGIEQGLLILTIIGIISLVLTQMSSMFSRVTKRKIKDTRASVEQATGIETMLVAYRYAEMQYLSAMTGCSSANSFLEALKNGSGCATPVIVFSSGTTDKGTTTDGTGKALYSFPGAGCTISQNSSTCKSGTHELVQSGGDDATRMIASSNITYKFYLTAPVPERHIAEFSGLIIDGDIKTKYAFAIRATLPNAAHLEADGRVTQESPDPLAKCSGSEWADFLVFNTAGRKCQRFTQLGGGTGLAYYEGRYFGFRPFDGQIIDMLYAADTSSTTYLVGEDGKVGSEKLFPTYEKSVLINVDDITLAGDEIYYVAGIGSDAHIGAYDPTVANTKRRKICALGQDGWGQAYDGIASLSSSDPLLPQEEDSTRIATFFLKTSGGDMLTTVVIATGAAAATTYQCYTVKDSTLQTVEYKRTFGFDRTDSTKPYYLY